MKQLDRAVGGVVITVQDEVGTRVAKFLVVFNPVGRDRNLAHFRQRLEEGVAAVMMRNASVRIRDRRDDPVRASYRQAELTADGRATLLGFVDKD